MKTLILMLSMLIVVSVYSQQGYICTLVENELQEKYPNTSVFYSDSTMYLVFYLTEISNELHVDVDTITSEKNLQSFANNFAKGIMRQREYLSIYGLFYFRIIFRYDLCDFPEKDIIINI